MTVINHNRLGGEMKITMEFLLPEEQEEKSQSLEDKFENAVKYRISPNHLGGEISNLGLLAQIAKEHCLAVFDRVYNKKLKDSGCSENYTMNSMQDFIKSIRKALEEA